MLKKVETNKAPGAIGPYSQAVEIENLVYTSGQTGMLPDGTMPEGVEAQARQAMENVKSILAAAGIGMDRVVKSLVFLQDMKDFAAFNAIYAEYMTGAVLPARSCVAVAALPKNALVEIEVIAKK